MSHGGRSFHKKDWAITAAAIAAAVAAPYVAPALFGASAAPVAGAAGMVPLAEAGVGGVVGSSAMGASAFGAPAAGAGLLGAYAPSAASTMTPMFTALAPEAAVGGSSIFGAGQGANALSALMANDGVGFGLQASAADPSIWQMLGKGSKTTLEAFEKAQKLQKMAKGPEPLAPAPAGRPPQGGGSTGGELAALMALMSNPVGQEQLKRLMRG